MNRGAAGKAGWVIKRIIDVAAVFDGPHATPKTVDAGPIFLGIGALQDGTINLGETRHVTAEDFQRWTRRVKPRANDVVFSYETKLGEAAIIPEGFDFCLGRRMGLVRLDEKHVVPRFFLYQYISPPFRDFLSGRTIRGATVDRISIKEFPSFPIAVPPLPEQQRIVGILDEAFDGIAAAKANAERNLQNARALMQSALQAALSPQGRQWLRTTIGEQVMLQRGFDITKDQQKPGSVPVVSSGGVKSFHNTAMVQAPGVVLGRKGTLGKVYYLADDFWPHDTTLWVKEFNGNDPRFTYYFFTSLDVTQLDSGTANPALNRNQVHPIEVYWPPPSQQKAIVEKLDALASETRRLESIYGQKLAALEALKKSLLHEAFNGGL